MRRLWHIGIGFILVAAAGLAALWMWFYSELETPYYGSFDTEVFVDIPKGANAAEAANLLARAGIIEHTLPFHIYLRYTDLGRRIQAGEYRFSDAASPKQIASRLISGDVFYRSITIPEGLTAQETISLLLENGLGNKTEMEKALKKTRWLREMNAKARNLEGYLFPETYRFRRKADSDEIMQTMVNQFRTQLAKVLSRHPVPDGWDVSSIVILASLIEKEVQKKEEGPLVASVLVNRLAKRMPLACDATIIYAMKMAGTYEGRLGKNDLRMESPYNTYLHPGLPPGPICNPGANALLSALNPAKTDLFYYVSRNDGSHQFSKDYGSHLRAVNLYQRPLARRP